MNSRTRKAALLATGGAAVAGLSLGAAGTANAAPSNVWDNVAQCESGGNWHINTGNGFSGGLQFTQSTWQAFGGSGLAANASRAEQIAVAQRVLAAQGPGAWPVCSVKAGLTSSNGGSASSYSAPQQQTQKQPQQQNTQDYTPRHSQQQSQTSRSTQRQAPQQQTQTQQPRHYAQAPQSSKTITVKSGDTLGKLAQRYHLSSWQSLWKANVNTVSDPNLIFVGQTLHLPA